MNRTDGVLVCLLVALAVGLAMPGYAGAAACFTVTAKTWESKNPKDTYTADAADAERDADLDFTATVSDAPPGTITWEWKHDGSVISTSQSMSYAFDSNHVGVQTVTVKATVDGQSATDDCTVNVVDYLIIDTVASRPDGKISFNDKNEVKGHVMPRSVSHLDTDLDWDCEDPPSEHCGLWDEAQGNLEYVETYESNNVWPTSNSFWGDDGLMLTLDKRVKEGTSIDERDDLDTAGDGRQASIDVDLFFEEEGTQNPGTGNPPNWFYYWAHTTAAEGTMTYDPNVTGKCLWDNPTYTCQLGPSICGPYTTPDVGKNANTSLDGIDHYAWTSRHEWQHHNQKTAWWGAGGYVAAQDSDGDHVPDTLEAGFDAAAGGPYDDGEEDTYTTDSLDNDIERHCVHTQTEWDVGSADDSDWAYPGKQW